MDEEAVDPSTADVETKNGGSLNRKRELSGSTSKKLLTGGNNQLVSGDQEITEMDDS